MSDILKQIAEIAEPAPEGSRWTGSSDSINRLRELAHASDKKFHVSKTGKYAPAALQGLVDYVSNRNGGLKDFAINAVKRITERYPNHAKSALKALKGLIAIESQPSKYPSKNYQHGVIIDAAKTIALADETLVRDALQIIAQAPHNRQGKAITQIAKAYPDSAKYAQTAMATLAMIARHPDTPPKHQKSLAIAARNIGTLDGMYDHSIQTLKDISTVEAMKELYMMATHEKIGRAPTTERKHMEPKARDAFQSMNGVATMAVRTLPNFPLTAKTVEILAGMKSVSASEAIADIASGKTTVQSNVSTATDPELFKKAAESLTVRGGNSDVEALSTIAQRSPSGNEAVIAFKAIIKIYENGLNGNNAAFTEKGIKKAAGELANTIIAPANLIARLTDENGLFGGKKAIEETKNIIPLFERAQSLRLIPGSEGGGVGASFAIDRMKNAAIAYARSQKALTLALKQ